MANLDREKIRQAVLANRESFRKALEQLKKSKEQQNRSKKGK